MTKLLASLVILLCTTVAYQWRTISQLRRGAAERSVLELNASSTPKPHEDRSSELLDAQVQEATDTLRADNQALKSQITELEGRLGSFEPFTPGKEHPAAAYFGSGRWVNVERNGLAQVVVTGSGDKLAVQVWGHGTSPGELIAWPELPLCRVHTGGEPDTYRRGLAVLPGLDVADHLLLTFERQGLRVDWLTVPNPGSNRNCAWKVTQLKRASE
jgi:hypothetical protein